MSYSDYLELDALFQAVGMPLSDDESIRPVFANLHDFLAHTAKLAVPKSEAAIHFNAFVLLRRGYKVEELTGAEHQKLSR